MGQVGRSEKNALQMRASRIWLPRFVMLNWHAKGRYVLGQNRNAQEAAVMSQLPLAQVQNNTSRGSSPGLTEPVKGIASGVVPWPIMRYGTREARRSTTNQPALPAPKPAAQPQVSTTTQRSVSEQTFRPLAQPLVPNQPVLRVPGTVTNPTTFSSQPTYQRNQSSRGSPSVLGCTVIFNEPSRLTWVRNPRHTGALVISSSPRWPAFSDRVVTSTPSLSTLAPQVDNVGRSLEVPTNAAPLLHTSTNGSEGVGTPGRSMAISIAIQTWNDNFTHGSGHGFGENLHAPSTPVPWYTNELQLN